MPYYGAGDYYQAGGYYRGDNYQAGGLFSVLGKIGKAALGGVKGFLTAGPTGAIAGVGRALVAPTGPRPLPAGLMPFGPGTTMSVPEPGITGMAHRIAPGGHPGYGRFKKDGTWTERRRPRMDVGNIKALRRANRRAHGFLRAYRSAVRYFVAKQPKGKAYVAFKKRSK